MQKEMAVMLKRKFLMLGNPFFVRFRLVVSSVAIVKKAAKKMGIFRYLRTLESP